MPQRFNVNEPTTLTAIQQFMNGYASPEAADADISARSPRGRNYLAKQYQALTGDAFADPFQDAARRRSQAVSPISRGDVLPTIAELSKGAGGPFSGGISAEEENALMQGMRGRTWSHFTDRDAVMDAINTARYKRVAADKLADPDMQLKTGDTSQSWADFETNKDLLAKRMNIAGVRELYERIGPEAFSRGTTEDDPRFARVQGGKDGKIEASDALHRIANDPEFKRELIRNPQNAIKAYYAATNGRDYRTDIIAAGQLRSEQQDEIKRVVQSVKNPEFNRLTGEWTKRVYRWNDDGEYESKKVPLDTREKAAFTSDAVERYMGLKMPSQLTPYGETPEEQQRHHQLALQYQAKGMSDEEAYLKAQNDLYKAQQRPAKPATGNVNSDEGLPAWAYADPRDMAAPAVNALAAPVNWSKGLYNLPLRGINTAMAVAGSDKRIPLIPDIPRMNNIPVPSEDVHFRPQAVRAFNDFMLPRVQGAARAFNDQPPLPMFPPRPTRPRGWRELGDL